MTSYCGTKKHCESTEPERHQMAKTSFFFLLLQRDSSKLHNSFTKVFAQNSILQWACSIPAHCLFTILKSHKALQTGHWRTMVSFVTPFSSHLCMCKKYLATKRNYYSRPLNYKYSQCAWRCFIIHC